MLSYTWTDAQYEDELDSVVTWTLYPEGRGTRLLLEHRGFAADDAIQQAARNLMDHGWSVYITDRLAAFLATSDTPSITE